MKGRGERGALVGGRRGNDCVRVSARTQYSDLLRGVLDFQRTPLQKCREVSLWVRFIKVSRLWWWCVGVGGFLPTVPRHPQ